MLRFIEINEKKQPVHPFKTEEDKQKYAKNNCDTFASASLLVPKDVVVIDFDEDNVTKDKEGNIITNKESFLINYLIKNYNPYWTKSQSNHYHLYFKKPKGVKIYNWADSFTCGGFQVDYRCENNGTAVVKVNGVMREAKETLTDEVINTLPELPILCYPLHNNVNLKTCFINMKEHDGRNTALFNHIREVYNKYQFKSEQLLELGNFINKNLFKEPLSDNEVESFSKRAKDYNLKGNSAVYDDNYNADIDLICLSDVKQKNVDWLWYPYIPLGRITLVVGDPGSGKSMLVLDWASRLSRGEPFPFHDEILNKDYVYPSKVIYQNGEDGISDTIKERLCMLKANQKNIFIINEIDNPIFSLEDLTRFEKAVKEQSPKLVVIDPLQRYLGDISMNSATEVRKLLAPIGNIAIKYNFALILVMHMNKTKQDDIYRALGSIDFVGIARSMLKIGPSEGGNKIISHVKASLGRKGNTILFEITDDGVKYLEQLDEKEEDMSKLKLKAREEAKEYILSTLKENNNMVASADMFERAKENDINSSTLNRAKKELDVKSIQVQGKWYWTLENDTDYQTLNENTDNLIT